MRARLAQRVRRPGALLLLATLAACAAMQPSMGYDRGTLIVEATDPRLRTLVWYGSASAVVNPQLRAQRLPAAIAQIFESFPARTAR